MAEIDWSSFGATILAVIIGAIAAFLILDFASGFSG